MSRQDDYESAAASSEIPREITVRVPHSEDFYDILAALRRLDAVNAGAPRTFAIRGETFTFEQVSALVDLLTQPDVTAHDVNNWWSPDDRHDQCELDEYWFAHSRPPRHS
ncbi:hypothetical protein [Nocardia alni]|uniref:hypothetical protein n=1 Tax=Nocardia alni TaxID=2815723 RepID=UPI001C21FC79|nr:hypothetical protein [Nocardia alni]